MEKGAGRLQEGGSKGLSVRTRLSHTGNQEVHLEEPKSPIECVFLPSSSCSDWNKLLNSHLTDCGVNNRSLQFNEEFLQSQRPRFTTPGPSSEARSAFKADWYLPRMHRCRGSASPNLSRQSLSKCSSCPVAEDHQETLQTTQKIGNKKTPKSSCERVRNRQWTCPAFHQ